MTSLYNASEVCTTRKIEYLWYNIIDNSPNLFFHRAELHYLYSNSKILDK